MDLDDGETSVLNPGGGIDDPIEEALIEMTNESGADNATVNVSETESNPHPDDNSFGLAGAT